jgi:hypothetical protein
LLAQRLSLQQFHNRKGHPTFVAQIEDNHDIGIRERGDSPGLALETRQDPTITRQVLRPDLDRDLPAQSRVARAINLAHRARAQRGEDFVGPELRAGSRRRKWQRLYPS